MNDTPLSGSHRMLFYHKDNIFNREISVAHFKPKMDS